MTNHKFKCLDCKFSFSFESENSNVNALAKEINIICPKCSKKWGDRGAKIEHQLNILESSSVKDKKKLSKTNIEASAEAVRQATQYRAAHPDEFAEISVQRPPDAPSQGPVIRGASVETVPSKVIDSLKDKAIPK